MSLRDLDKVFYPSSIALVGASKHEGSLGAVLARNMLTGGFDGPIMPVNPHYRAIGGVLTWKDIASLPIVPDLGIVATPPDSVPDVIRDLREKGAKGAVIITAGFGEGNDSEGRARMEKLREAAGPLRIMGPNVLGLMVPGIGLNASFAHIQPLKGDLAFVAQSGAMLTSVLDWATARGIGFSHMVSLGDMADIDFGDMLNFLVNDPKVRAILLYVEAIRDTAKFMSAARAASRTKPVVVIKAGRAAEGAKAASSHTGALAGSDRVYDTAFRRAGMLRVYDMQELFDAVQTLSSRVRRSGIQQRGDRLAILTNGGGIGVLATDSLIEQGGHLAELKPETIAALDEVLPKTWSHGNPIDIIGDAPGERYKAALETLLTDRSVDAVLVLNCPTAIGDPLDAAQATVTATAGKQVPVFTSWIGEHSTADARRLFVRNGIPTYNTAEEAVRAFMHNVRYDRNQQQLMQVPSATLKDWTPDRAKVRAIIDDALKENREWLSEAEAKTVLSAYGIPVARTLTATSPDEAYEAARSFGPDEMVAVKILSRDITHKSDVGGVVLNLETPEQVREAARTMLDRMTREFPDARIEGVTVQQMVRRPKAHELIVGINDDPQFGPVILFGKGGKEVEVVGDTAMGLPPLNASLARSLIEDTHIYALLKGYRDEPAADLDAIGRTLTLVSQLAIDFAELKELDINPLIADAHGVIALDARIKVAKAVGNPHDRLAIKPYPEDLEGEIALRDGRHMSVRPIRPEDAPSLMEMVTRTDDEDIRMRFLHPMRKLPEQLAARLTQIDYSREMAFIAYFPDTPDEILGVVRLIADPDGIRAEYAIMVRSDWKGAGIGFALMNKAIAYARASGIREIFGEVLTENRGMLMLCRELGFRIETDPDDQSLRHVVLDLESDRKASRS